MATYTILKSIRLTGCIVDDKLELRTMRAPDESADLLDVASDVLPVRVELYDFVDSSQWDFIESGIWCRGGGDYAWAEFTEYTDGDGYERHEVTAEQAGTSNQKPKTIHIKIKPVIDAPDPT